jgi:hypothetical protein
VCLLRLAEEADLQYVAWNCVYVKESEEGRGKGLAKGRMKSHREGIQRNEGRR